MKITNVETFIVDAGFRPWIFVKVETDEGVTGYGECSDGRSPTGVVGTIEDLAPVLVGQDPRAFEMRFWDMLPPRTSVSRGHSRKGHRGHRVRPPRRQGQGARHIP